MLVSLSTEVGVVKMEDAFPTWYMHLTLFENTQLHMSRKTEKWKRTPCFTFFTFTSFIFSLLIAQKIKKHNDQGVGSLTTITTNHPVQLSFTEFVFVLLILKFYASRLRFAVFLESMLLGTPNLDHCQTKWRKERSYNGEKMT